MPSRPILLFLIAALTSACAAVEQHEVVRALESRQPVRCATAEGDIRVLKSEKASVEQRIAEGVMSIVPAGAALGILTRTEITKIEVATGAYNEMLDDRIAQIESECGVQGN